MDSLHLSWSKPWTERYTAQSSSLLLFKLSWRHINCVVQYIHTGLFHIICFSTQLLCFPKSNAGNWTTGESCPVPQWTGQLLKELFRCTGHPYMTPHSSQVVCTQEWRKDQRKRCSKGGKTSKQRITRLRNTPAPTRYQGKSETDGDLITDLLVLDQSLTQNTMLSA